MREPCAIWRTKTLQGGAIAGKDAFHFNSPRAGGEYRLSGTAKALVDKLDDAQKARLTSWLVDQRLAGNECPELTSSEIQRWSHAPQKRLGDRRDSLLRTVADHIPHLGKSMRYYESAFIYNLDDIRSRENPYWAEADHLLATTESVLIGEVETLIAFATSNGLLINDAGDLSLTFEGYSHLDSLQQKASASVQAFVAMWFGAEVAAAYDKGIAPAIMDAGYKPMRIDQKEHNNKIDDEIIAEIRRSKFMVADFTCGMIGRGGKAMAIPRGGVYYEAGYAQGLGIPVIWCCRSDHIGHVHFDTRQFNHITWDSPEDLRAKLKNRIGAVMGDGPLTKN